MPIIPTTYLTHKPNVPPTALMPWTILVRPKGGTTGIVCKRYVHLQKIQLVEECRRLRAVHNLSLHGAVSVLGVNHTILIRWTAKLPALKATRGRLQQSANKGHVGQLDSLKFELLAWVFACREQGIVITKAQVVFKASALLHSFGAKTFEARLKAVSRFIGQHGYVYHMKTNKATRLPHAVYAQALDFLATTHLLLVGLHCNKRYIWKMGQMPLWFLYHYLKTLTKQGTKTIHDRKTSSNTKRATAALTVSAAGEWVKLMIIFGSRGVELLGKS
jgi:hypothetical protein